MKLIFKHSTRCPISLRAKNEMDRFLKNNQTDLAFEFIDVIENRTRSQEVAETYGIKHESPQVILLSSSDTVLWTASHMSITEEKIKQAMSDSFSG